MTDNHLQRPATGATQTAAKTIAAETVKLVANAVLGLSIARKSCLLYPATHEQVERSQALARDGIAAALKARNPLVLTVLADRLSMNGEPLDPKSTVFKEFALVLKLLGIVAVSFDQVPEDEQLSNFIQLLTIDPVSARKKGGVTAEAASLASSGITIEIIDYSRLHIALEKEPQASQPSASTPVMWRNFVRHMQSIDTRNNSGGPAVIHEACTPSEMAALLNTNQIGPDEAFAYYQKLISDLIRQDQSDTTPASTVLQGLSDFHRLIMELTPALQRQFLAAAFDQLADNAPAPEAGSLIESMGGALIVQMLQQANNNGKEISPSLLAFVGKMGLLAHGSLSAETSAEELESLLEREAYETYVDDGYDKMLKSINRRQLQSDSAGEFDRLRADIEESLTPLQINARVGEALMSLMALSQDDAEYRDFGRQLALLPNDLLTDGNFDLLNRLFDFISREQQARTEPQKKKVAGLVLNDLRHPALVGQVVNLTSRLQNEAKAPALEFIARLGETAVAEILDNLPPGQCLEKNDNWFELLQANAPLAVDEALKRLKDPRPDYLRSLLSVIRQLGNSHDAEEVKPLLDHANLDVRMAALAVLLHCHNPWGELRLRDLLNRPRSEETLYALELAGAYRVKAVLPILAAWLEKRAGMRNDIDRLEAAIRTIGKIADPSSLKIMNRLARRRSLFNRKYQLRLKQTLFDSLGKFPLEQIRELLLVGLRTRDVAVREACRRLMRSANPSHLTEQTAP